MTNQPHPGDRSNTDTPAAGAAGGQLPLSIWATAQTDSRAQRRGRYLPESTQHPARMLPAIAAHAITTYTRPGDTVLDPMCGIGTTLVEAIHTGRHAIGIEYEPRWAHLATANIHHTYNRQHTNTGTGTAVVKHGDATHLPNLLPAARHGTIALVLTSPPYGATVHGKVRPTPGNGGHKHANTYSDHTRDRNNLAHRSPAGLLDGLTRILTGCVPLLRPGGHVVITARPWRKHGTLIDLPSAVITAGTAAGLQPTERCAALLAAVRDSRLTARPSFFQLQHVRRARTTGTPLHLIAHEDVLIFRLTWKPAGSAELKDRQREPECPSHSLSHVDG